MATYKIAKVTEEEGKYGSYLPWEFPALSREMYNSLPTLKSSE